MRKLLAFALLASLCFTLTAPAAEREPKPLVVLSLSSYDQAKEDPAGMQFVGESPDMPTWLSGLFQLYSQGKDLAGIDSSRPWGAVIQLGDELSAYAFIPVSDPETLLSELYEHVESTEDIGGGIYRVTGTDSQKHLYAKLLGDWIIVGQSAKCLAHVVQQPTTLLDGLDQKYDVALRLTVKNVPADKGQKLLAHLDKTFGPILRRTTSDATVKILGQAAASMEDVTFGWCRH